MMMVQAVFKTFKLDEIKEALVDIGVTNFTVIEARSYRGQTLEIYRGSEYVVDFLPKLVLIALVEDGTAERTAETIRAAAKTDKGNDGYVMTMPINQFHEI